MRKILPVLAVVPLITGTAMAAQPLTDNQMDTVIAGGYGNCWHCQSPSLWPWHQPWWL